MEADWFDALRRSLAAPPSRRQALRLLVGSALGGLLPLGTLSTDARKGGKGKGKGKAKKGRGSGRLLQPRNAWLMPGSLPNTTRLHQSRGLPGHIGGL
jgi:hypothetical protein